MLKKQIMCIEDNIIHWIYELPEEIKHILMISFVRSIIFSAIDIFLPVYIYQSFGLKTAILFLLFSYGLFTPLSVILFKLYAEREPLEYVQLFSIFFGVLGSLIVIFLKAKISILISAFLLNLHIIWYWIPKHYIIIGFGRQKDKVEESVFIDMIYNISSFILPFVSSLIIYHLGYSIYYSLTTFAVLSLAFIIHKLLKRKKSLVSRKYFKPSWKFKSLFFLEGINVGSIRYLLTIYLFTTILNKVEIYGSLRGVALVLTSLLGFLIARKIDKESKYDLSLKSGILTSLVILLIWAVPNGYISILLLVLLTSSFALQSIAPSAFLYEYGKRYDPGIVLTREIFISIGKVFVYSIFFFRPDLIYIPVITFFLYRFLLEKTIEKI